MYHKRDPQAVEAKMQIAAKLIADGMLKYEAAEMLGVSRMTFYKDWTKWCNKNHAELREKFTEEMQEYLIKQRRLYKKAVQQNKIKDAANINKDTIEKLQSFGIIPKAKEKVEVTGQISWNQFWDKIVKRKDDEQENKPRLD